MKTKARNKKKLVKSRKTYSVRKSNRKKQPKRSLVKAKISRSFSKPQSERDALTTQKALTAINLMKRDRRSFSQATRLAHIKPSTFIKYAGNGIYRAGPGKPWKVTKIDPLALPMTVLTPLGPTTVLVRGFRERSRLGRYDIALRKWRRGLPGGEKALRSFRGQAVAGHVLITDVRLLAKLEDADALDFETLYSSFAGSK